jgi:hypothetical protein
MGSEEACCRTRVVERDAGGKYYSICEINNTISVIFSIFAVYYYIPPSI